MKNKFLKSFSIFFLLIFVFLLLLVPNSFAANSDLKYKKSLIDKGFPEGYATELSKIKAKHPNWDFEPAFVNGTLEEEINRQGSYTWSFNENKGPRLYTRPDIRLKDNEDAYAVSSKMALAYYMDANSFISNDSDIFMFQQQSFNPSSQTVAAVQNILNGSFMASPDGRIKYQAFNGSIQYIPKSYAQVIWNAGKKYDINPIYLAQKILLEVGRNGSGTVSGAYGDFNSKYPKWRGYYNFFNWNAYSHDGLNRVEAGLDFAKGNNWSNPEISIYEGARMTASRYIAKGQDTPYFQKFNINPKSKTTFPHQYMAASHAPLVESDGTYKSYENSGLLNTANTFIIPVFKNYGKADIVQLEFNYPDKSAKANVSVNARTGPGTNYNKIKTLTSGKKVKSYYGLRVSKNASLKDKWQNPLWLRVDVDGKSAYTAEDYVDVSKTVKVAPGETVQLKYLKYPNNASEKPMFMTQDSRIAVVDFNCGVVRGRALGKTKAVIFSKNGAFDVINIEVSNSSNPITPPITPPSTNEEITSSVYNIYSNLIEGVMPKTKVSDFKSKINSPKNIKITKDGKTLSDNDYITTDSIISYNTSSGSQRKYTVVIRGDMNGDGVLTVADAATVMYFVMNKPNLANSYRLAGDANGNGVINVTDAAQIMLWIANN